MWRLLLVFVVLAGMVACKSGNAGQKHTAHKQPVVYLKATIDGTAWQAEQVTLNPLGDMLIIKGTDGEGRVLSLNLPKATGLQTLPIVTGGQVGITWSVSRKEGFTYSVPYQGYDDAGVITITLNKDGYLGGAFSSSISNGGRVISITDGAFVVQSEQ